MKRNLLYLFTLTALAFSSCERLPLTVRSGNVVVSYTLNDDVLYEKPSRPELVRLGIYDINTGKQLYWTPTYLNNDYVFELEPGTYNIVAWTTGTSSTQFTHTNEYSQITAETSTHGEASGYKIISSPDHSFISVLDEYTIPVVASTENKHHINIQLNPFIDTWKIEVRKVRRLNNLMDAQFYIYNQSMDYRLSKRMPEGLAVVNKKGEAQCSEKDSLVVCTFGTFGMRSVAEGKVTVQVVLTDIAGYKYETYVDVAEQVEDIDNTKHVLYIDFDTELHPLTQGGFSPTTDEWNENVEHWELE